MSLLSTSLCVCVCKILLIPICQVSQQELFVELLLLSSSSSSSSTSSSTFSSFSSTATTSSPTNTTSSTSSSTCAPYALCCENDFKEYSVSDDHSRVWASSFCQALRYDLHFIPSPLDSNCITSVGRGQYGRNAWVSSALFDCLT